MIEILAMGIDLGTSGVRLSIINSSKKLIYSSSIEYEHGLEKYEDWKRCCITLIKDIPKEIKFKLSACSIAGTSGTLLACNKKGQPLNNAIPYDLYYPEENDFIYKNFPGTSSNLTLHTSFSRASKLIKEFGNDIIIRHQADWISSWLTDNWIYGEEGNNLKLGWDIRQKNWPLIYKKLSWNKCLPKIISSGKIIGKISNSLSIELDLPSSLLIISGTTDSNAAVIAADAKEDEGVTILGSTIVIKKFVNNPIYSEGISNHIVLKKWLCGGASNSGGIVLRKFFNNKELIELSKQIKPETESGINLLPLAKKGERFPKFDPNLQPILEPRPVSDCLYLHALLEGLARIEAEGWEKLSQLGVPLPSRIITVGGGAKNATWKRIRERIIGIPISNNLKHPAVGVAQIALKAVSSKEKKA